VCVILVSSLTVTCPCAHIFQRLAKCFASLRHLQSIERAISQSVMLLLVTALTTTQLDYGSATLAGIPRHLMYRLQSVMNAAAHLVYKSRKYDHVTHLLRDLHWLRVPERIQFRLAVQVYRCRHNLAPLYLANDLHWTDESEVLQQL